MLMVGFFSNCTEEDKKKVKKQIPRMNQSSRMIIANYVSYVLP